MNHECCIACRPPEKHCMSGVNCEYFYGESTAQVNGKIVRYQPMIQVTMKDGRLLFFPEVNLTAFKVALKNDFFVEIEGKGVNKSEIKYYEPMPAEYDVLLGLTEDQRAFAIAEFKQYKQALGVEPPRSVKLKKIARIVEGKNT